MSGRMMSNALVAVDTLVSPIFAMALSQTEKLVCIQQYDALPSTFDQALLLPRAENTAHRMQCGAGHLRNVLTADWKINLYTVLDFAPRLLGETQERMCDALLDLFAGHFKYPCLGVLQSAAHGLQRASSQSRELCDEWTPHSRWP